MRGWSRKAMMWTSGGMVVLTLAVWRADLQAMAVGMALALFVLIAYLRRTPRVQVRRRPSHLRVLEGDTYEMGFDVGAMEGWADVVELHDTIPGYMDLAGGSNHLVLPLFKGEMRRASYALSCPLRGAYRLGPLTLRTTDAMEFFEQEDMVPGVHEVDVVPLYLELRSLDLQARALKYNMGPVTINELGRSTDFYSIREYVRGDPYKQINWKASAKRRKLMVNEDEKETLSDCTVFVDSRTLVSIGTPLDNFHELALRTTLGLSRTLVASKNRVMVITYNDSVNIVPPGLGTAHNRTVQAMLVETVARGNLTFDWAVGYARPFIKPRSDVVVFSPLVSDMTFYPTVLGLIRTGHRVVVVTAPLEDYEERATGAQGSRALLMGLQRTTNIAELEAAGVPVIEVEPDEPQLSVLVRVGAALGGERLDVTALEGRDAEDLPEMEEIDVPGGRTIPSSLQEEVLGVRTAMPWMMGLQTLALATLLVACVASWYLSADVWDAINTDVWGTLVDTPTYMLLICTAVVMGWALAMLLGYLKHWRQRAPKSNLVLLAYAVIFLLVLWHVVNAVMALDIGASPTALVWDLVLLPPLLGAMAVFRRSFWMAGLAMVTLVLFGLVDANPIDDAGLCLLMGITVAAFLDLTWAVVRFDRMYILGGFGQERGQGRSLHLFNDALVRYLVVFGVVLVFTTMASTIIILLPSWYASNPSPGAPWPVDADTLMAVFYLLLWVVAMAVVGRWTAIAFMGSARGQQAIRWARGRMLLPRPGRRGPDEQGRGGEMEGREEVHWEEEAPSPEVPVPSG